MVHFFDKDLSEEFYWSLKSRRNIDSIVVLVPNYEEAFNEFCAQFKQIEAAGGWVKNGSQKSLFIYRLDKWDLPKGKMEKGESIEETAIREVEEECGIDKLKIVRQLPDTYHIYELGGKTIVKRTYWFEMESEFDGNLIPQTEEDITKAEWLTDDEIKNKVLVNTYQSIKRIITSSL